MTSEKTVNDPPRRTTSDGPSLPMGSEDARHIAAAVLEVLSGAINAPDAAEALGVDVARYYQVEKKALAGLVAGCELHPPGEKPVDCTKENEALKKENRTLRQEVLRYQALARAAALASGFNGEKAVKARKGARRKAPPRGLKVSKSLRRKSG